MNSHKQNGCHAPLISDFSSASKCLLAGECDVVLERYWRCTYNGCLECKQSNSLKTFKTPTDIYLYSIIQLPSIFPLSRSNKKLSLVANNVPE